MEATLENVKVGDKVIFSDGWYECISTVTKVTKKQIYLGLGRYCKCDGRPFRAEPSDTIRIKPYSEEGEKRVRLKQRIGEIASFLRNYRYENPSFEDFENVYNHLKDAEKVIKSLK